MTAEEFIENFDKSEYGNDFNSLIEILMIEFAKHHVEEALEAASDWVGEIEGTDFNLKDSYSLNNIK